MNTPHNQRPRTRNTRTHGLTHIFLYTYTHSHTLAYTHISGISTTICKSFGCSTFAADDHAPPLRYLTADMSVDCDSDEYTAITIWAGVTLGMFPVGVPAFMHWVMYKNKDKIGGRVLRAGDEDIEHLAVWFEPYKPDKWW